MTDNTYDFGFTAVDEAPTGTTPTAPVRAELPAEAMDSVMEKLYDIEAKLISMDNSTLISEHKDLVAGDVQQKLKTLEDMIMPLLQNLKKNPEKEYIHWPNRTAIIDKQIEKIKAVTQFYE
jgi:hypothetical protein|tara:strand:- start:251 stop:613 length:363 start_codon:yes stop_codon:yes gene_type:complete